MARPGWLNDNLNRAFPFLYGSVAWPAAGPATVRQLPHASIVDAGFQAGSASGFAAEQHRVVLARVRRSADRFFFDFESDAPGLYGLPMTFSRTVTDERWLTEHRDVLDPELSLSLADVCHEPRWFGYLITGDLTALADLLPADGELSGESGAGVIEPALVQTLAGTYVHGVSLANGDRTRTDSPDACPTLIWPFTTGLVYVAAICLTGDLLLKPGYNASIAQDDTANSLTFRAVVGDGEGQPCAEVPLFPGEVPPPGSPFLSGGTACGDVLRSINGLGGAQFQLTAGRGVSIIPNPEQNEVIINVDFHGLALCHAVSRISEVVGGGDNC